MERPATEIMINLGNPDLAFKTSFLPNDGVGLARMEFIVGESIKAHPLALIHPEQVTDLEARNEISRLTRGYPSGEAFFVERLSEGIGTIGAAFWPKPVVVRMSDFKTNEYASLLGGADFEPEEENPMIGFRGASRYAHPAYEEGFALECEAMKRVREEMGLTNVVLMIPFVRRVNEAEKVLERMAELGLRRGENGLKVYAMCEIPNNVLLIQQFAELFDGFSIGSNDLTQLTLGVDRDSEIVAFDYDERDDGVKEMLRLAVDGCRRAHIHSGLCGQAPPTTPTWPSTSSSWVSTPSASTRTRWSRPPSGSWRWRRSRLVPAGASWSAPPASSSDSAQLRARGARGSRPARGPPGAAPARTPPAPPREASPVLRRGRRGPPRQAGRSPPRRRRRPPAGAGREGAQMLALAAGRAARQLGGDPAASSSLARKASAWARVAAPASSSRRASSRQSRL